MTRTENELRETILRISGAHPEKCMKCGKCSASCPAYADMEYHPHEFVSMLQRGELAPLLRSEAQYLCFSCMACVERCPRGVAPGRLVEAVRVVQLREQGGSRMKPEQVTRLLAAKQPQEEELPQQLLVSAFRKYAR